MSDVAVDTHIDALSAASLRRIIEPELELVGEVGSGSVLPPELLSVAGLDLPLSDEQLVRLSREELASITEATVRFEAGLMGVFALRIATADDVADAQTVYALHEIGEETRHSRLFIQMLRQLGPRAPHPLHAAFFARLRALAIKGFIGRDAAVDVFVLGGEEITDLFQHQAMSHAATDPYVVAVNRYHRQEEARHVAFARTILPADWAAASAFDRWLVRFVVPRVMASLFSMLVHPGVYRAVGLPGWRTWSRVNRSPSRRHTRAVALRPVLDAMIRAGVVERGRIPRPWQAVCLVNREGYPNERQEERANP